MIMVQTTLKIVTFFHFRMSILINTQKGVKYTQKLLYFLGLGSMVKKHKNTKNLTKMVKFINNFFIK